MATLKTAYAAAASLTWTLAALASDTNLIAGRQSTAIDNTTNLYVDALVGGSITAGTTPTAAQIEIWAFGSWDGGTTYSAGAGASDANFSPTSEKIEMRLLGIIQTDTTTGHVYEFGPYSIAQAFGGVMPDHWGLFAVHNCVVAFNTGSAKYSGINYTVA